MFMREVLDVRASRPKNRHMTQATDIPEWTLGWRLQRSLAHAGVSMDEMAEELGISRRMVSRWINEHARPRTAYLKVWALRTGVPLEWLLTGGGISLLIQTPAPGSAAAA